MIEIENTFIDLLLVMAKLKRSLTVSESLRLANELIDGTLTQKKIIAWKKKYKIFHKNPDDYGKVGISYWLNSMKRKCHLLKS